MEKNKVKLADALGLRKELHRKVDVLTGIKNNAQFEVKMARKAAHEGIDDIIAQVPKLTASQVTHELDSFASKLRRIDSAIQHANWLHDIEVDMDIPLPYIEPKLELTHKTA